MGKNIRQGDRRGKSRPRHIARQALPSREKEGRPLIGRMVLPTENRTAHRLRIAFNRAANKLGKMGHVTFLILPGGALTFPWPTALDRRISPEADTSTALFLLKKEAGRTLDAFLARLPAATRGAFRAHAEYLSIGIDSDGTRNSVELVAVYDLHRKKIIRWTGKSHPVSWQQRRLIREKDLRTHMLRLQGHRVVLLGCHDLNLYSPRAAAKAKGWKKRNILKFVGSTRRFRPDIILQHPHATDSPHIWNLCWRTVEKLFPTVSHFASGIRYANPGDKPRATLAVVLRKTTKGQVVDLVV